MQHVYQTAEFYRQPPGISESGEKGEEKNKAGGYVLDVCVELAPGAKKVYKDAKIILQSEALAAGELEDTQTLTEIIRLFRGRD